MITDDIKRLYYYEKQFLGARDFRDEQSYHIEMRRRHSIAHHNWGIVAGLDIIQDPVSLIWSLQPGMAVDGYGREVLVFDPEPLDVQSVADQVGNSPVPAFLKLWIAYQLEKANKPAAGFSVCDVEDQFMRTRETFRLIYQFQTVPPFDLGKGANPTNDDPELEANWPQSYQDLPDDPAIRWPLYLGTLTWNIDPNNPAQKTVTTYFPIDPNDSQERHYIGVVATEVEAPNNKLVIRGRGNPRPLPPNPPDPGYNGVPVAIEGTLEIERQVTADTNLNVLGNVGIGSSSLPDTKLQVTGGTDATLSDGSGYVVIGLPAAKNIVMDNHGILARNQQGNSELDLQVEGGDLIIHKNKVGTETVIKDSGQVGMGTTTPQGRLTLKGAQQPQQGQLTFFSNNADVEYDGGSDGTFIFRNSAANGKTAFTGGDVGIGTPVPAVKLDVENGGVYIRHPLADGQGGVALEVGNQSPASNALPNGRIGFPGYGIQHGQLRWVPVGGHNGRFEFIDSSNASPSGDYGPAPGLVDTRARNGVFTGNVGIGTTNPTHRLEVAGDLAASNLFSGVAFRIFGGQTASNQWQNYDPGGVHRGILVDVNTSAAGFTATPLYLTALHGNSSHWVTTGGSSIYQPTPTGFRVYVRYADGTAPTLADAINFNWHIQWIGIQL